MPILEVGEPISVAEGGIVALSTRMISVEDLDTPVNDIRFVLESPPIYGYITVEGQTRGKTRISRLN